MIFQGIETEEVIVIHLMIMECYAKKNVNFHHSNRLNKIH